MVMNMSYKTIWNESVKTKKFPSLDKNLKTDVLVIGAGVTGILCGYELSKRNINYTIVEMDRIGSKTSKDTTAFLTIQHDTLYQDLIKKEGLIKAKEYLDLNLKALKKYERLSKIYDFDYESCSSVFFSKDLELIKNEKKAYDDLNYESKIIEDIPFFENNVKGIKVFNQAVIHPLKLINELASNLNIYEETKIVKIKGNVAYTNKGITINFNNLIIATHYPIINISGLYILKLTQRRSYVATIKDKSVDNTYCSIDEDGLYFRKYKDYLVIGGNDRDTKNFEIHDFKKRIEDKFNTKVIQIWSGQDTITLDGIPYIGRYSLFHNNYYVATGFNLWGFTWAMVSSFIIADMIEKKKEYPLVNPRRNMCNKNLFINVINSTKHLLTIKKPRCKHLGCALKYNKKEHVWECPCHGSRYDKDGNVLDGPAQKKLNIKKEY